MLQLNNIIQEGDNAYHDPNLDKRGKDLLNFWVGEALNKFSNNQTALGSLELPLNNTQNNWIKIQNNYLLICGNGSNNNECFN